MALSRIPTIPDFSAEPHSMLAAMRAMKSLLEQLAGQRQSAAVGSPLMFVQITAPAPGGQTEIRKGDLWINPFTNKLYWWNGYWVQVVV